MDELDPLLGCTGFDWDDQNALKNWERHRVTTTECEEVFLRSPLVVRHDSLHAKQEVRYYALDQTARDRLLFVAFTIRGDLVRVVSARDIEGGLPVNMKKRMPKLTSEERERDFWASHDSTEYLDWKKAKRVKLPNLKPSLKTISIRLPVSMIEDLKVLANQRDVPYQSLLKVFLAERVGRELGAK